MIGIETVRRERNALIIWLLRACVGSLFCLATLAYGQGASDALAFSIEGNGSVTSTLNPVNFIFGQYACTSTWVQFANGQSLTGSYRTASIVNANVGALIIQFASTTSATLTLPDGRQIPIERYRF